MITVAEAGTMGIDSVVSGCKGMSGASSGDARIVGPVTRGGIAGVILGAHWTVVLPARLSGRRVVST